MHEARGLQTLKDLIAASPFRAWTNFECLDGQGQGNEIDTLVLGRRRLHLVEQKAFTGIIGDGNKSTWSLSMDVRRHAQQSPSLRRRRKAQRLNCRLEEELARAGVR